MSGAPSPNPQPSRKKAFTKYRPPLWVNGMPSEWDATDVMICLAEIAPNGLPPGTLVRSKYSGIGEVRAWANQLGGKAAVPVTFVNGRHSYCSRKDLTVLCDGLDPLINLPLALNEKGC